MSGPRTSGSNINKKTRVLITGKYYGVVLTGAAASAEAISTTQMQGQQARCGLRTLENARVTGADIRLRKRKR